jgi:EmrB/QacA subfamily drug resistance transporter
VALPTLVRDLGATTSQLQWIIDAYILVFAGLLLTAGSLGDRFGRKRVLSAGLAVFGIASVVAAYAGSPGILIAARAFMGVGAASIMPLTLSILPNVFPPEERSKAIAVWTAGSGLGLTLGPVIGGLLLNHFWWGSVFLINVPVVAVALAAGFFLIPESRDPSKPRVDPGGALLSIGGLACLTYGIIEAPSKGWMGISTLAALALGSILLTSFVAWEMRTVHPMLDLRLFDNPAFAWASVVLALASFALFGMLFFVPQYLQFVLGETPLGTGVRLIPLVAALAVGAPLSDCLVRCFGKKPVVGSGLLLVVGGLALLSRTGVETGYGYVAFCLILLGAGLGLAMAPSIDMVMGALPPERTGVGAGLNNAVRQVGGALGVAILGSLLATTYATRVKSAASGLPGWAADTISESIGTATWIASQVGGESGQTLLETAREAFVGGMGEASLVAAAVTLAGAAIAFAFLPQRTVEAGPRAAGPEKKRV